jgi:electron transfer flavoprotein alpha subunit
LRRTRWTNWCNCCTTKQKLFNATNCNNMPVLVLTEHTEGTIKKKSLEAVQYAAAIARQTGTTVTAVATGSVSEQALQALGNYGAQKVLHVPDQRLNQLHDRAFTRLLITAARQEDSRVIVLVSDANGKAIAPRLAVALDAALITGALSVPDTTKDFEVKKAVFSGKAFAFVQAKAEIQVITLTPNSFRLQPETGTATVAELKVDFTDRDFAVQVQQVQRLEGAIPLTDAERVVSGGRGMKGPENWGLIEDLAKELDAATACSRPVADSHWRPHHEHVGQTGTAIRPNLYIAAGISGAIQHLAGVNGSRTIVVINKDPEAPFFKAATYGVVGDVLEVLPRLTEAVRKFKASTH